MAAQPKVGKRFEFTEDELKIYEQVKKAIHRDGYTIKSVTVMLWKLYLSGKLQPQIDQYSGRSGTS